MEKKTHNIHISDKLKKTVMGTIHNEIESVHYRIHGTIANKNDITKLTSLTLDQLNKHVSDQSGLKTQWDLNSNDFLPILIEVKKGTNANSLFNMKNGAKPACSYHRASNLKWKACKDDKGVGLEELEQIAKDELVEDAKTAAFYSALSFYEGD